MNLPPCCTPSDDATPAEIAYCAYNAGGDPATAGLNYAGQPCPTWQNLPDNIRAKWEAVVEGSFDAPLMEAAAELVEATGATKIEVAVVTGDKAIIVGAIEFEGSDIQPSLFGLTTPAAAEA